MNNKGFNIAVMVLFGLLGISALIAVFMGAIDQLLIVFVCALIFVISYFDYRKENNKK